MLNTKCKYIFSMECIPQCFKFYRCSKSSKNNRNFTTYNNSEHRETIGLFINKSMLVLNVS